MAVVLMIGCAILWLFIQASLKDQGVAPRSRGSLRYQRRKARKLGLSVDQVKVRPRASSWEPSDPVGSSHVSDLAWSFGVAALGIVLIFGGLVVIALNHIDGSWWFAWAFIVLVALWMAGERRKNRDQGD